jgi:hypothetical protein
MEIELHDEMQSHMAEPFPVSVIKGEEYGEVDAVMIGADIYGWATRAASLSADERNRLSRARAELTRSIPDFPDGAKPYYKRLVKIATLALAQ